MRFLKERRFRLVSMFLAPLLILTAGTVSTAAPPAPGVRDPRLAGAWRFDENGWIYVHLQGTPEQIGFQHGWLLAPEIEDGFRAVQLIDTHDTKRGWTFFRDAARHMLWPAIGPEYRAELRGIAEGIKARGIPMDLDDVVALNAMAELADYYVPWYNARHKTPSAPHLRPAGHCSAFIATGSWTKGGRIVMAHNNWTGFLDGERWRIIFDILPANGHRVLMDGFPGVIASDDDFGINSAGIMITETTITGFHGWNPEGVPEFVRARQALQYSNSIDDYVRLMTTKNNGGYANDWLIGDRKTGEVAQLELGLRHFRVWRTKDGYYAGSNVARDPGVIAQETDFNPQVSSFSPNARQIRWKELMEAHKGRIDVSLAESFLGDHFDPIEKRDDPDERTLCGHVETSSRGAKYWDWGPYYPGGAVQGKATDSAMAEKLSFEARMGHPCGTAFRAGAFLRAHPEYSWETSLLHDLKAGPWTRFQAGEAGER